MGRSQSSSVHSPTSKNLTSAGSNFLAAFLQTWQTAAGRPILVRTETIGWEKSQRKFHRESSWTSFFCNRMLSKGPSLQAREIWHRCRIWISEITSSTVPFQELWAVSPTFRPSTSLRTICRASFQQLLPQGLTLLHLPEIHSCVAPHLRVHKQSVIITQAGWVQGQSWVWMWEEQGY